MSAYWLVFSLFVFHAIIRIRPSLLPVNARYWSIEWVSIYILLVLFVGLRYQVGADWVVYAGNFATMRVQALPLWEQLSIGRDVGFDFINWLAIQLGQDIALVNFISAILFSYGLVIFCRNQALPSLSMLVAIPYLVTVVAMGYTRQSIAIGLFMLALVVLEKGNYWRYIGLVIFAGLFHASAFVFLPLAIVVAERQVIIKILVPVLFIAVLYFFILDSTLHFVRVTYFYELGRWGYILSPGSTIRFAMVLFTALLFLLHINSLQTNRIVTSIYAIRIWKIFVFSSFVMVILFIMIPSSTFVDRFLLYWLPLQVFVFGNIPVIYLRNKYIYYSIYFGVITYSFLVFAVWLFLSNNSYTWFPYSNYLWL